MSVLSAPSPLPDQVHCRHISIPTQVKGLMRVICKWLEQVLSRSLFFFVYHRPGCGRRFTVISNLRRHLRVHQQPHSRRRLTAEQRRAHVKELMQRKNVTALTDANYDIIGWFFPPPPLSVGCSSSPSSVSSSPPTSPSLNMPYLESSNFRLLKPKMRPIRPECLSIKNLLN